MNGGEKKEVKRGRNLRGGDIKDCKHTCKSPYYVDLSSSELGMYLKRKNCGKF